MTTAIPVSVQGCERCAYSASELDARSECPACGGLLELRHDLTIEAQTAKRRFARRRTTRNRLDVSGVWRYRELVLPTVRDADVVTYPEGNTPLIARERVSVYAGVDQLLLKHEGMNPTGSFKDRGMTVAITQARRTNARAVACASTGNTSASLAAYAAHAGLPALVFVPAGQVAIGKIAQTIAYGARTLVVRGNFDACLTLARACAAQLGIQLLNSINPFRLEGQKTIVFELLDQMGWRAPDWLALPAGNLGNTSAFGKALREAKVVGLIDRLPRLLAVQASGAAPFARSFEQGFRERLTASPETVATAIRIGDPASWDRAVRAMHETNGVVASVTDDEILEAKATIDAAGVGCEPASAASVAGVRALRERGVIGQRDRVVCVLTGNLLKDPGVVTRYHQETEPAPPLANRVVEIDADLSAVERLLRKSNLEPSRP